MPVLLVLYQEQLTGVKGSQARIKTARRNTNNLRYADDTALLSESKEE